MSQFKKIHEKNQAMYFGQQSALGVPIPDACLALFTLAGSIAVSASVTIVFTGTTGSASSVGGAVTPTLTVTLSGTGTVTPANLISVLTNFSVNGTTPVTINGVTYTITSSNFNTGPNSTNAFTFTSNNNVTNNLTIRDNRGVALPATSGALISGTATGITYSNYTTNLLQSSAGLAITTIDGSPTRDTGAVEYVAGVLSRNEYTYQKDVFIELAVETPQQILGNQSNALTALGTLLTANTATGAGIFGVFEACGGFVTLRTSAVGSLYPNGFLQVDNTQPSSTYLTGDLHLTSADDIINDKLWKFYDLQGMFDTNAGMGDLPMLKFKFKGNVSNPINNLVPQQYPNMGVQYVDVTPSILPANLVLSQVVPLADTYGSTIAYANTTWTLPLDASGSTAVSNQLQINVTAGHGINTGDIRMVQIAGETGPDKATYNGNYVAVAVSSTALLISLIAVPSGLPTGTPTIAIGNTAAVQFNFGSFTASNFFGFDYERYMAGQLIGFTKGAVPTDVNVSILEDQSGTTNFDPDANITKFFACQIKWGTGPGYYTTMMWNNLQITQVKRGKIGKFLARDVTMRNTGNSFLIYS